MHISLGTFKPISTSEVEEHLLEKERYIIKEGEADKINEAIRAGNKVIAVGTTSTRVLEHSFRNGGIVAGEGYTGLYIYPGYRFKVVSGIVTNLHMPRSTPLLLASAFGGYRLISQAYSYAVDRGFRFYSYGDSMLII